MQTITQSSERRTNKLRQSLSKVKLIFKGSLDIRGLANNEFISRKQSINKFCGSFIVRKLKLSLQCIRLDLIKWWVERFED